MPSARQRTLDDLRLRSEYDRIAGSIVRCESAAIKEKPLSFWAMPRDRRLPLVFLPRPLGQLARLTFDELASTAGVGPKKLEALVRLMERALVRGLEGGSAAENGAVTSAEESFGSNHFDAMSVSELQWTQWRDSARRHQLGHEFLGRLAGSLQDLPSVLWRVPLSTYFEASLTDIRQLRTYGEKRVRVVLQIFHDIDRAFGRAEIASHLDMEMGPKRMRGVGRYLEDIERQGVQPTEQELRERVAMPIVEQLRIDLGDVVHSLISERFGITGPAQSVRSQASRLGLTRARIYQLLESCARAMEVRWPEGRRLLETLLESRQLDRRREGDLALLVGFRDLCFPRKLAAPADAVMI
jgi:hypothetical protein